MPAATPPLDLLRTRVWYCELQSVLGASTHADVYRALLHKSANAGKFCELDRTYPGKWAKGQRSAARWTDTINQLLCSDILTQTWNLGPQGLPIWEAFHPTEGNSVAWYFATEIGADTRKMRPDEAADAVMKAPVPPIWKLAAATSAALHFYFPKVGEDSTEGDIDVHIMLIDALRQAKADLAKHALDPLTWATTMLDQIEYFSQSVTLPRLAFNDLIRPAISK